MTPDDEIKYRQDIVTGHRATDALALIKQICGSLRQEALEAIISTSPQLECLRTELICTVRALDSIDQRLGVLVEEGGAARLLLSSIIEGKYE